MRLATGGRRGYGNHAKGRGASHQAGPRPAAQVLGQLAPGTSAVHLHRLPVETAALPRGRGACTATPHAERVMVCRTLHVRAAVGWSEDVLICGIGGRELRGSFPPRRRHSDRGRALHGRYRTLPGASGGPCGTPRRARGLDKGARLETLPDVAIACREYEGARRRPLLPPTD